MQRFKRGVAAFLLLVILMTMVPVPTFAQEGEFTEPAEAVEPAELTESAEVTEPAVEEVTIEPERNGSDSATETVVEGLTYTVADGAVAITGYTGNLTELIIPATIEGKPVTAINEYAFSNCLNLTGINIPASVTVIGKDAFNGCESLTGIWVDGNNTAYSSDDSGVLFDKNKTTLIKAPAKINGSYTIPADVTTICAEAFYWCTSLTSITIPASVTVIGKDAFNGCESLTGIWVDGNNAVYSSDDSGVLLDKNKTAIITVPLAVSGDYTIPAGVTAIDDWTFSGCTNITGIFVPASVSSIGHRAFDCYESLTGIWVDENNTVYSSDASGVLFDKNKTIVISVPRAITGTYTIPDGVTTIGHSAFLASNLTGVNIPDSVTTFETFAFYGCGLTSLTIPDSVTTIGNDVFVECKSLTSVTIGNGLTKIPGCMFWVCLDLTSVIVGNKVTSIDDNAFGYCENLNSIALSDSVKTIADNAFYDCKNITEVIFCGTQTQWEQIEIGEEGNQSFLDATVKYHNWTAGDCVTPKTCSICGFTDDSALGHSWVDADCDTPKTCSVCSATEGAALGHSWVDASCKAPKTCSVCSATEGGTVGHNYVDGYCSVCGAVEILSSGTCGASVNWTLDSTGKLTVFGTGPMDDYSGDVSEAPGWYAFCDQIKTIVIEDGVETIGDRAFTGCENLTAVSILGDITKVGMSAFGGCVNLADIALPESVTDIGLNAFVQCESLTEFKIPGDVTVIEGGTFMLCSGLKTVTIPDGVTTIGQGAFSDCYSLTDIRIPDSVTTIEKWAFMACSSLKSIAIPSKVTQIGVNTFGGCTNLEYITIPASVTSIEIPAFESCANLGHVLFTGTEAQWEALDVTEDGDTYLSKAIVHCGAKGDEIGADGVCSICPPEEPEPEEPIPGPHVHKYKSGVCTVCKLPKGLTYTINNDEVTVTGYTGSLAKLSIPTYIDSKPVTAIGWDAFYNNRTLTRVVIPEGVTTIGGSAFNTCTSLTQIVLPDSLTTIGPMAFEWCNRLTSITIPERVTSIGYGAFRNCSKLTSVNIPDGVTTIGIQTFWGCTNLAGINIPASVTSISGNAFERCRIWVDENNPAYSSDANGALFNKNKTVLLKVPSVITGTYTIPDGVTIIGESAFQSCTKLTGVVIPEGVTTIGKQAFVGCQFTGITIPGSVETIGQWAFEKCKLTSINIPDGVTTIGFEAFLNCKNLTSITIPASVTSIGNKAFSGCAALAEICVDENNPAYSTDARGVLFNKNKTILLKAPYAITGTYTIPDGVIRIDEAAFQDCSKLNTVTIPDGVTGISYAAFSRCSSLTNITIPDSVTTIGSLAFADCEDLASIQIPDSVTSIGDFAFNNCCSLTGINIPDGVTIIDNCTFAGCERLVNVTIPDSVTAIGFSAFDGCSKLASIDIPNSVTTIGNMAFWGCDSFTSIVIPDSVTSLGDYMFVECDNLAKVTIGNGVTRIGEHAFNGCERLSSVVIGKSVTTIGQAAFANCERLSSVAIPASMKTIEGFAFAECVKLKSVTYCGTEDQWEQIEISKKIETGSSGNKYILNATVKYHKWNAATCTESKSCTLCGEISSGTELGHNMVRGNCTRCQAVDPDYIPVGIVTQPVSVAVPEGENAVATVEAVGIDLTYAWYYTSNGDDTTFSKSSTTTASYSATMDESRDGRKVYCKITDAYGDTVKTDTVTLTLFVPLVITQQPVDVEVIEGQTAKVTVTATGKSITYQWFYRNPGETDFAASSAKTAAYSTTMNEARDGREVYCVITDKDGNSVTTDTVTLSMKPRTPLEITRQPASVTVKNGETAETTVEATGDNLTYVWYYKNAGASAFTKSSTTTATYSTAMNLSRDGREVYCVITDAYGQTVKTETVTLTLEKTPLVITRQPVSVTVKMDETAEATVQATGDSLTYVWYYKNTGASAFTKSSTTTATYSTAMSLARDGREVYCVITDVYGQSVTTETVTLMLEKTPLVITRQPADVTVKMGETAEATVQATGDSLTYVWYYKNAGATKFTKSSTTTATYSAAMNLSRDGRQVYCKITDAYGNTVKTETVTLSLEKTPLAITRQPASVTVKMGETAAATVQASGDNLTYVWYYKNAGATKFAKSSTTTATYSTAMSLARDGREVYCVITDVYGQSVTTETVTLTLEKTPLVITRQPASVTVASGETAKVTVEVTGDNLTYVWYYKNAGATNFSKSTTTTATYSAVMNATRNGRQVYCKITDAYGNTVKTETVTLSMS